jgi:hypothetical protein
MHRRKDLWGPDGTSSCLPQPTRFFSLTFLTAEEFDPLRFIDHRQKTYLAKNPFIFLPFNAGPRICLGQQFAYNEMSFMLVRLLQSFDHIELDESSRPEEGRPRAEWRAEGQEGRKRIERVYPKNHLTMYAEVSGFFLSLLYGSNSSTL